LAKLRPDQADDAFETEAESQNQAGVYFDDVGEADVYVGNPDPAISAYTKGQRFVFTALHANTGASTLNVSGKGARTILKNNDVALASGDIEAGQIVEVVDDGTQYQMVSQIANESTGSAVNDANNILSNQVLGG
jgi:hypothetical protein